MNVFVSQQTTGSTINLRNLETSLLNDQLDIMLQYAINCSIGHNACVNTKQNFPICDKKPALCVEICFEKFHQ